MVRGAICTLLAIGGAALVYAITVVPPTNASFYPRCQLHSLTGLHCPGCGTTRALHSLFNGQIEQAIAWNPIALLAVPFLAVALIRSLWSWLWDIPITTSRKNPAWIAVVIGTILVLFGILRNIPVEPFSRLAPHEILTGERPASAGR
jgi:hypothetical protein